jgi:hypothetical protein
VTTPAPIRVAVLGNSVPLLVVPSRQRREDGTYAERLPRLLAEAGLTAAVSCHARLFELIHEGARRYGHDIAPLQPDVLVLHYGVLELQPNVLPTTLNRSLTRSGPGGRGLRRLWQRGLAPRLWPAARAWQRWASARVGVRTWRLRPDRFVAELDHLVRVARATQALVLVLDVHDTGPRLEHFMPGTARRRAVLQGAVRAYVDDRADPGVRLVAVSELVRPLGDAASVDGLHLGPEGHALVAEALAKEITAYGAG